MPFQAEALNDLSSRPPWSVTMHARYFFAGLLEPDPGVVGAVPQAAAHKVSPPAARAATILIPRAWRKTLSFPLSPQPVRRCHDPERTPAIRPGTFVRSGTARALSGRD